MYLFFDIGGTKTRMAFSETGENFEAPIVFPTPKNFSHFAAAWKWELRKLGEEKKITQVIGGIPGMLDAKKESSSVLPQLPDWNGKPIKQELEKILDAPVTLENDADLVGLGESVFGAGKGKKIVMYLTVSTGVGGTRIVNGFFDHQNFGFEPGHQLIISQGREVTSLENLISGEAIKRRFHAYAEDIYDAKIWDEVCWYLALGIHNSLLLWSPEIVVVGGSVAINKIDLDRVMFYLRQFPSIINTFPPVVKAELEDYGGLWGAVAYLRHRKEKIL